MDGARDMKKTILAIFMVCLMTATVFSAISVSARDDQYVTGPVEKVGDSNPPDSAPTDPAPTDPNDGLFEPRNGGIGVSVSGILRSNRIEGATVTVMGLGIPVPYDYCKTKSTDRQGGAGFGVYSLFYGSDNDFLPVLLCGSVYVISVSHPGYYSQIKTIFLRWSDRYYTWEPRLIPKIGEGASGSPLDIDVINADAIV